jgi:hypothetical protein
VVEDVILHQFAHEAVNGAPRCGQPLQDIGAMGVLFERAKGGFQLSNDLLGAGNKFELSRGICDTA